MKLNDKQKMDILLLFVVGIGVGLAIGMGVHLFLNQNKEEETFVYRLETEELTSCSKEAKLYYETENQKIYLYCLNSIKVKDKENLLELKNYYQGHPGVLEEILGNMQQVTVYDDESILYHDNNQLTVHGISILKCNTGTGNNNIYIGPSSMGYEAHFCQEETLGEGMKKFTRTYSVLNVTPSNDLKYLYVTIKQFQNEEVTTVRILKELAHSLQINKNYEFQFQIGNTPIEDTISSIFEKATLVSIQETDKVGLDQIQDSI